jgi:hyperosmotically inducible protein
MKLSIFAAVTFLAAGPAVVNAAIQSAPATQSAPSDRQLSNEIATRIANDKTLSTDAIKVTVKNGVVTLSGLVGKDEDKAAAERLARVPGVTRVENNLKSREKATDKVEGTAGAVADKTKEGAKKVGGATKKAAGKTAEKTTDGWITTRIKTKFMGDEALRASAIDVDTNDHVVTLTGAVPTETARAKAVALAKEVEGVKSVVDNLKVTSK